MVKTYKHMDMGAESSYHYAFSIFAFLHCLFSSSWLVGSFIIPLLVSESKIFLQVLEKMAPHCSTVRDVFTEELEEVLQ